MQYVVADWSQLGDFEVTTPVADLLQEIEAEGVPTTEDQASLHLSIHETLLDIMAQLLCDALCIRPVL